MHDFLAPSSASRWVKCAYAPTIEAAYPEQEASPASLEGTAAHWVNELVLRGTPPAIDQQAPNCVAVTADMLEGATMVRDEIFSKLGGNWRQRLFVEHSVRCPSIHATKNGGTPDYFAWDRLPDGRLILYVWDYKFGHEIVEAFECWQLINYVSGIVDHAGVSALQDRNVVVDMCIIQPRAPHRDGPVRHWVTTLADLRGYFNNLRNAAEAATSTITPPKATPTVEGCKNCNGRHACEALQRETFSAMAYSQSGQALDLTPHALGLELTMARRAVKLLEARMSGLEAQASAMIKRGERVPFWMMEQSPGRLKWTIPATDVIAMGQMFGINVAAEPDAITPKQAITAGMDAAVVNRFAKRYDTIKLTYDNGAKARLTFSSSVAK